MFKVGDKIETIPSRIKGTIFGYEDHLNGRGYSIDWDAGIHLGSKVYCWYAHELTLIMDGNDILKGML